MRVKDIILKQIDKNVCHLVDYSSLYGYIAALTRRQDYDVAIKFIDDALVILKARREWNMVDALFVKKASIYKNQLANASQALLELERCIAEYEQRGLLAECSTYAMAASILQSQERLVEAAKYFDLADISAREPSGQYAAAVLRNLFNAGSKSAFIERTFAATRQYPNNDVIQVWNAVALRLQGKEDKADQLMLERRLSNSFKRKNRCAARAAMPRNGKQAYTALTSEVFDTAGTRLKITEVIDPDLEETYGIEPGLVV